MNLKELISAVITTSGISTEDLFDDEVKKLEENIRIAANLGQDCIAKEVYPLKAGTMVKGEEWIPPEDYFALLQYTGGKAQPYIDNDGRECLKLDPEKEYRITYIRTPAAVQNKEDVFELPSQVMNALIYFCCFRILSPSNDKREYAYFKNLYDQQCVNIAASIRKRAHVVGGDDVV